MGISNLVCMGDGLQDSMSQATPRYFSFQDEVLSGGYLDSAANRFLIRMVFSRISPETIKPWSMLTQVDLVNYMDISHRYHQKLNANALQAALNGGPLGVMRSAKDADILEYLDSGVRLLTPNDISAQPAPIRSFRMESTD